MTPGIFERYSGNPLITARDLPYQSNAVFNAGAVQLGEEVLLLIRVETCSGRSHLIPARSQDGKSQWRVAPRALLHPVESNAYYESYGAEDCRITPLTMPDGEDCYLITYVAFSELGAGVALAKTRDFESVERLGLVLPPNDKNAMVFPRKFGDCYAMLHRPDVGGGCIWISFSPDLIYWGRPKLLIRPRGGPWWDGVRIGAGPTPIETERGWLVIYHGVKEVAGGPIYRLGAVLLDKDDPTRVLGRTHRWIFGPETDYERTGDAPNIVFPCGAVVRDNAVWIYYGAADCSLCLAWANIDDILTVIEEQN